ncbi:malate dehydrogenase (quinone) [Sphingomonas sanguinis]|uniref:malate dehydrogenase (quinone) n=1 Tax=Sphingomonas sanguinis TaxID=33051 RepID=UPI001C55C9EF|nr:malate dehydrogenase (quinone) [Sphingomonas sanguinis]QXT36701.1 malate dehydrogenase (quinone) [Sphingomonas sanguinis]
MTPIEKASNMHSDDRNQRSRARASEAAAQGGISRRAMMGSALAASTAAVAPFAAEAAGSEHKVDVLLIGGGIMSATLGVLLRELEPSWTIELVERLDKVAEESSNGWNNAGTGHSALCELNYTPVNEADGKVEIKKAIEINEQFQVTRQFLSHQLRTGVLKNPRSFINSTPHMNLVWGDENVAFLQKRHAALLASPLFSGMEFTTDPRQIAQWVPLMIEGRKAGQKIAATRSVLGTDCEWGEVTRQYIRALQGQPGVTLTTGHEVRSLERNADGTWRVTARDRKTDEKRIITARFVFAGAGGGALPILQKSGIPEGDDYAGFPVGGSFLVTENPAIAKRHMAKVYGKASTGSPPMSVPHLDTRYLNGKQVLLFGPFATFSTKFLKEGSYFDLPKSVTLDNFRPMLAVGWDEFSLVEYLAGQLMMSQEDRMNALREYFPNAKDGDWRLWQAGQRVQIIKRDPKKGGVLKLGTEIVASKDGSIAALLGASPGASTAPSIMLNLIKKVFPDRLATPAWQAKIREIVPSYGTALNEDRDLLAHEWAATAETLQLAFAPPPVSAPSTTEAPRPEATRVSPNRHPDLAL